MLSATLLLGAATVVGSWPTLDMSPAPAVAPTLVEFTEGMQAWGDLPLSAYVDVPFFLTSSDAKAWILNEEPSVGTTFTLTCPASATGGKYQVCEFYVFVYHCAPCVFNGGFPSTLLADEWHVGSCAPWFTVNGGDKHKMNTFRRQLNAGEQAVFTSTENARFVGFAATPYGVDCVQSTMSGECNTLPHCAWQEGECVDYWCPRRFFPSGVRPEPCLTCADEDLVPTPAEPVTTPAPTDVPIPDTPVPTPAPTDVPVPDTPVPTPEPTDVPVPDTPVPTPEPTDVPTPEPVPETPVPTNPTQTCKVCVYSCKDDVEERNSCVKDDSSDLELTKDGSTQQVIGIRWRNMCVPKDAIIEQAYIEFEADEYDSATAQVKIGVVKSDSASSWGSNAKLPSKRTLESNIVTWTITETWYTDSYYQSPDISTAVQKVVDRSGWAQGNAMSVVITKGSYSGVRVAESKDGNGKGPCLIIKYRLPNEDPVPPPPTDEPTPAPGGVTCPPKVRKAYSTLTCAERNHYVQAVQALKERDATLSTKWYDMMVATHNQQSLYCHLTSAFLPWHRWYLVQYENELRKMPGFECVTVPYWDYERDCDNKYASAPLKDKTFGDSDNHRNWYKCVTSGIAKDWVTANGGCLKRKHSSSGFDSEPAIRDFIKYTPNFVDFWTGLEGSPHAGPHNFIGGHMGSMSSPDDPLFFMLHANVDRMWALWQDYHNYNTVDKNNLEWKHYTADNGPRSFSASHFNSGNTMPFTYNSGGSKLSNFVDPVKIRDMWDIEDLPYGNGYTYGVDNMALQLGNCKAGTWSWVTPGYLPKLTCCGDGTKDDEGGEQCDDGNMVNGDGCSSTCKWESGSNTREAATLSTGATEVKSGDVDSKNKEFAEGIPRFVGCIIGDSDILMPASDVEPDLEDGLPRITDQAVCRCYCASEITVTAEDAWCTEMLGVSLDSEACIKAKRLDVPNCTC